MKRLELEKLSSFFSPLPNRKKKTKYALKRWDIEISHGAGYCVLGCCVVDAGSIPSKYPGFLLVKLQNFLVCLQIPEAEIYLLLFLDVIHCLPRVKY